MLNKSTWYEKLCGLNLEKERDDRLSSSDRPVSVFFGILTRKFWSLIRLNMLHSILTAPAFLLVTAVVSGFLFPGMGDSADGQIAQRIFIGFLCVSFSVVTVGPFQAGFAYVIRLYATEKNAFILHDYWKAARENLKVSLTVSVIDIVAVIFMMTGYHFYSVMQGTLGGLAVILRILILIIALFYLTMHFYLYPMMVTVDLGVKELYGNAARFAIGFPGPNMLMLLILFAFSFLIFSNTILGIVIAFVIGYSVNGLASGFYALRGIDRYVVRKINPEGIYAPDLGEDPIKILKK